MIKVFERFRERVERTPEKVILSSAGEDGREVTFREMDLISGKVYRYLKEHGIGREDFVNILLPRGVEPLIAMLGVWKAGAAFVTLEEDYPAERVAYIQKDCGCKLVLDRAAWEEILRSEPLPGFENVDLHDAAFAVYTSGTTGNPKGALHEYGNLDIIGRCLTEDGVSYFEGVQSFAMIAPLYFVVTDIVFLSCVMDAGVRVSIIPTHVVKDPALLTETFIKDGMDACFCAPSLFRLFRKIPSLKMIIMGSEPANGIWSEDPALRLYNGYGMSETGFCMTAGKLDRPNVIAPVGKPLAGMKITIRDEDGRAVPDGEEGELCVENPYVRGYIHLPEETEKVFSNGEFHTRDMVRLLPDGAYEVLGRIDDMIKVNGNRVEPAEVEAVVRRVSDLQQILVRGFQEGENAYLCLYYSDDVEPDAEDLRQKLEGALPYYMIPSHYIHLDALPRTATGKLSRQLLPKPVEEAGTYAAPANDTEGAICTAMASVLKRERFSAEDDFYRLGGSSITSMEVVAACTLPELTINQIFRGRTPRKIAELYLAEQAETEKSVKNAALLTSPCRLTQSQLGIFLECEKHEGEAVYNNPLLFRLSPDTDMERLSHALEQTMKAHPGLFAGITEDEEGLPAMQYMPSYMEQEICVHVRMTEDAFEQEKENLVQPFLIRKERLFRIRLFETGVAKYLFLDFHHIMFDGTSMQILLADIDRALAGETAIPEEWTAYDAAIAEQKERAGAGWEKAKTWNLKQFGDCDPASLPEGDRKEKEVRYGDKTFTLNLSLRELIEFCEKAGTTENVFTTAAFGYLLSAYTMKKEVLFSTIYNGRRDPRTNRTVSMFVTTLPVLCRTEKDMPVSAYLSDLKEQLLGSMANDLYSFAELAADTGISSAVQYDWQADVLTLPKDSRLKMTREELPFVATGDALSVELYPMDGKLILHIQYHGNLYSEEYIAGFARCFDHVLSEMMVREKISEVSLLPDGMKQEILRLSRGEEYIYNKEETWMDLFRAQAVKTPEMAAVVDEGSSYSYQALDRASDRVASWLIENGVEENSFVAVRMGRVKEFHAAVLGIHKAGAAYIPIDVEYPEERVEYMLSDSGAKIVLTDEKLAEILDGETPAAPQKPRCTPEHLAYMIYTSGSTGRPKGVMIQHKALLNFVHYTRTSWELDEKSHNALFANYAFDGSIEDAFPPLTVGGTVYIVPETARHDPQEMKEYIRKNGITGGFFPTQFGQLLGADEEVPLDYLSIGGEAVTSIPRVTGKVYDTYGPTEFTINATCCELKKGRQYKNIPIGRPLYNCMGLILDEYGHLLPRGLVGELCLSGPQMALGYWNRPDLTAEKFTLADPTGEGPIRIYHTGDLARYNEEGNLEYLGRIDTQVKLRGFRIELGEIESRAAGYEGILQTAADVRKDRLVLYYTADREVNPDALRAFLSESLTEYMVPTVYMHLSAMPMTPNGKIDRKKLPDPEQIDEKDFVSPETETEKALCEIVCRILGTERIGVTADLVAYGLSSIGAMRLSAEISRSLHVRAAVADIMKIPVIRSIAAKIDQAGEGIPAGIPVHEKQERYPITENQRGIFIDWQMNPGTTQYNIPSVYLYERMDGGKLADALRQVIDAHSYIKAGIEYAEGDVMLRRKDEDAAEIEVIALEQEPDQDFFQSLVMPFDLLSDRLYRIQIYTFGENAWLFTDIHHIVFDGLSDLVLSSEVKKALQDEMIEAEKVTAFDYALYEKELLQSDAYGKAEAFFDKLLSDAQAARILPEKNPDGQAGCMLSVTAEAEAVNDFCRRNGVTTGSFLSAAFAETLRRITREERSMYTTISNGRSADEALQNCFGMFVRTLPVVTMETKELTAEEYVKAFHDTLQEIYANDYYPYTRMVERFDLKSEIMFVYQGGIYEDTEAGKDEENGIRPKMVPLQPDTAKMPLIIEVLPEGDFFRFVIEYDGRMYGKEEMTRLGKAIANVTEGLAKEKRVRDVSLVDADELQEIIQASYGGTLEYDESRTWLDLFHDMVSEFPDQRAVVFGTGQYTYAELDKVSDSVAAYLRSKGVEENDFVAIRMDRIKEYIAAMIGIHKAGAAYVPMDPEYPEARIAYMLEDSGAKLVLTEREIEEAAEGFRDAEPMNLATPAHRAYMIYTSGSTGKPKGVVILHKGLRALVAWQQALIDHEKGLRNLCHSSFSFDGSVYDLFPALASGGEVHVLAGEDRKDPEKIHEYICRNRIDGLFLNTQIGMFMVSHYPDMNLKYILVGGEKMLSGTRTNINLYNAYGPTEFTSICTYFRVDREKNYDNIPIGRIVGNEWAFICDEYGKAMPMGMAGELCLAGRQIAEGYWKRPELTSEKFIECPFLPGERMYRTGDLVKYNRNGELEYQSRIDTQVKLRGFRIELGEIETLAANYEGIEQAAAEVRKDQLVLYYKPDRAVDRDALKNYLAENMADYMVPTVFMQLDRMPLTPVGKIDRKKLPDPDLSDREEIVLPETETEHLVAEIAKKILGAEQISVTADLVSHGLSSIGAMRLAAEISGAFDVRVAVADIMRNPVIREIAATIDGADVDVSGGLSAYEKRELYPITENQRGIFIDWQMNPETTQYNIPSVAVFTEMDGEKLAEAVRRVIDAHSYLKTGFVYANDDIMLQRRDEEPAEVSVIALSGEPDRSFFQKLVVPFDLLHDRLYRIGIYTCKEKVWLFTDIHHIVFDGLSGHIFSRDVKAALDGMAVEAEQITAFDYALYENELLNSEVYQSTETYFDQLLSGAEAARIMPEKTPEGPSSCIITDTVEAKEILDFTRRAGVTAGSFLSAAFSETLRRITREEKIMYTTISSGRSAGEALQNCFGMFVKTLPVVSMDTKELTSLAYVKAFHKTLQEVFAKEYYPYTRMVERLDLKAEIMFAYQGGFSDLIGEESSSPNFGKPETIDFALDTAKMPISVDVYPEGDHFCIVNEYDGRIYGRKEMERFTRAFANAAKNLAREEWVKNVGLTDEAEKQEVLRLSRGDRLEYNPEETWLDLFLAQTAKTPQNIAVADAVSSYTYEALNRDSDKIAAWLQQNGVRENHFVAVMMGRVKEFHAAVIAIHKAGAAYLPVDPDYPEDRVQYMLSDSGTQMVLTEEKVAEILAGNLSAAGMQLKCAPENLAYMIYTSGSTGRPKGVMIQQKALMNFVQFTRICYELTEKSHISLFASFSFDGSVEDIFPALTAGGTVYTVPESARHDPVEMKDYIRKNGITGGFFPTQFGQLLGADEELPLDYLSIGGEAMTSIPKARGKVFNTYGPTEFTINSTVCELKKDRQYKIIPIGRPLDNCTALVLDGYGQMLPQGMVGELCLSGPQISLGYWNRPDLTAEKFPLADPTGEGPVRIYHTGDLVRYNEEGNLEYQGRIDTQVKLRGFRIELGEIESVASGFEGIAQVAAEVRKNQLVLYYTSEETIDREALRDFMAIGLTEYMVPTVYMQLSAMPMSPNGKIDRKKLPEPELRDVRTEYAEPATPLEKEICEEFAKILDLEKVGATDDFFRIGGSSIAAARVLTFAFGKGYRIVYKDIFENPTPRKLAAVIEGISKDVRSNQAADYDYRKIDELIAQNSMEHIDEIVSKPVGDVILTGATGFLGIHVLNRLIEKRESRITCLLRKGHLKTVEERLKNLLMYYFGNPYEELFGERIFCVEGDITDRDSLLQLDGIPADMIINCAASVKHFVNDDSLDRINFHGVENLIEVCLRNRMKLVHISTTSVGGTVEAGRDGMLCENSLYFGQNVDNDYVRTKFLAERAILEARLEKGLSAVILRAGNLLGRYGDGEFQINFKTNAFMRSIAAFHQLGACPVTALAESAECSPIDAVADAVLSLAGVNREFSIFHIMNNHTVTMGDIIFALQKHGMKIDIVTASEFEKIMQQASEKESFSDAVMSLMAYDERDAEKNVSVECNNYFTISALYRLGFKWPIVDDAYLEKVIGAVDTLGFFDMK